MNLRSNYTKEFLGYVKPLADPLIATTLPTNGDVLKSVLFFGEKNRKRKGEKAFEIDAVGLTAMMCEKTWFKASLVPIKSEAVKARVTTLRDSYFKVKKISKKQREKYPETFKTKVSGFKKECDEIFNIFSGYTVFRDKNEEDIEFLKLQLASGGKQGKIATIDTETTAKALKSLARISKEKESYERRALSDCIKNTSNLIPINS